MNREFDFDDIGKKTPYRTPDSFFEDVQQKVMERTWGTVRPKRNRRRLLIATALAAAAMLAGVLFIPSYFGTGDVPAAKENMLAAESGSSDQPDKWIYELSDEELEELVSFSENDIFLN